MNETVLVRKHSSNTRVKVIRRTVGLTVRQDLLTKAREYGINLSKLLETSLIQTLEPNAQAFSLSTGSLFGKRESVRAGSSVWYECLTCTPSDLERFKEFLVVDLQRSRETAVEKVRYVRKFSETLGKDKVSREDIREYLKGLKGEAVYRNSLAALKVFFRDFCNKPELVQSFRFPVSQFKPKDVLTREDLRRFYEAIDSKTGKALFLFYATSGLRKSEVLSLGPEDIDFSRRMITPACHSGATKHSYLSFYNEEAETMLRRIRRDPERLFKVGERQYHRIWREAAARSGVYITPKKLRVWFCSEMAMLGVSDSYINAFCGRTPKSVLAKHYLDYSPEKLKLIYEKANLKVFA